MHNFFTKYLVIVSLFAFFLTGCGSAYKNQSSNAESTSAASAKLGTQWGDGIESHVQTVNLYRINSTPSDVVTINYSALPYKGKSISELMLNGGQVGFSVINDNHNKLPLVKNNNTVSLRGTLGESYQLFYRNYSKNTYEIVATVDGIDVLNGQAGSLSNRGYVLEPYSTLTIEGFRKSNSEVAAFTFSNSANAYANHTDEGSPQNIGVIGTAIFELCNPNQKAQSNSPKAFPADNSNGSYAKPPKY